MTGGAGTGRDATEPGARTIAAYRAAHLGDAGGYSATTHSFMREDVVLHMYEIMLLFRRAFTSLGWTPAAVGEKRLLEVGCAWGLRLAQLLGFGFAPEHLHGLDLLEPYITEARRRHPAMRFEVGSATAMTAAAGAYDVSCAVMTLSAMLDPATIDAALAEMCRVSREGVIIVDSFDPRQEDERHGAVYFRGVAPAHLERLRARPDVADIVLLGSFWTSSRLVWRLHGLLRRLAPSLAYAVAVRWLAPHSHRGYLIRLRPAPGSAA
ncbi:MAG TPA: class I SAM-dependent methyltransferase [Gemmatimonadales bacterium]|nr:class I SAM-dependent methyltransferase [Gemmatimonadales bacterium]